MNIGIFSGSFNPVHHGHLMIANYITEFTALDEIWFVVSPQNPLKESVLLIDKHLRLQMVRMALIGFEKLKACDFEFHLPTPSYTIDTLKALEKSYPEHTFSLVIGADNWASFERWKNHEEIIQNYPIYIYKRLNYTVSFNEKPPLNVTLLDSPIIEISSTFIRQNIQEGKNIQAFLPENVWKFVGEKKLYK